VIEVHGSIATASCTSCGESYPLEEVESLFDVTGSRPAGCAGKVKPDVVLFGEMRRRHGAGGAALLVRGPAALHRLLARGPSVAGLPG
jgi:NAD-dependent SIR2 family protein deacetylase